MADRGLVDSQSFLKAAQRHQYICFPNSGDEILRKIVDGRFVDFQRFLKLTLTQESIRKLRMNPRIFRAYLFCPTGPCQLVGEKSKLLGTLSQIAKRPGG